MPRYIDAEKAEKVFKDIFCKNCNSYTGIRCFCCYMRDGADIYADMPTEDVQPVVCCKDCEYYTDNINDPNLRKGFCNRVEMNYFDKRLPDDYCSYGIKMDGDCL